MTNALQGLRHRSIKHATKQRSAPGRVLARASLDLDFINRKSWLEVVRGKGAPANDDTFGGLLAVARSGAVATYFDEGGVLRTAAANTPRWDNYPDTCLPRGLLCEPGRTNSIANNTGAGAVVGTPGTIPTGWGFSGTTPTYQVVAIGIESGIEFIDVRFTGSSTFSMNFCGSTDIAASNNAAWSTSVFLKIASGSLANLTLNVSMAQRTAAGAALASLNSPAIVPTSAALRTQRFGYSATTNDATIGRLQPRVLATATGAFDVTLRFGLPQQELGNTVTSVIKTSSGAVSRSADVPTVSSVAWLAASAGTCIVEFELRQVAPYRGAAFAINDGTAANRIYGLAQNSNGVQLGVVMTAASTGVVDTRFTSVQGQIETLAYGYAANDVAVSRNGASPSTDSSVTVPTGLTNLNLGHELGADQLGGWLRRFTYVPARLRDAVLPALSVPTTWELSVETQRVRDRWAALGAPAPEAVIVSVDRNIIRPAITSGAWAVLDGLYAHAVHAEVAALVNLVSPYGASAVANAATFTAKVGYVGNGAGNVALEPSLSAAVKYTLNSAHFGAFVSSDVAADNDPVIGPGSNAGANLRVNMNPRTAAGAFAGQINDASNLPVPAITTSIGHWGMNRSGASARQAYRDGAQIGSDTTAASGVPSAYLTILRYATQRGTRTVAASHHGGSMTAGQWAAMAAGLAGYVSSIATI